MWGRLQSGGALMLAATEPQVIQQPRGRVTDGGHSPNNHDDSFPFVLSFSSFCALHRFRRARSALSCYLPLFVPFPMPGVLWALPILSALGGIGWRGSMLLAGKG